MADIFISYARTDRDKVEPIAKALEAKGWTVWWDAHIRSGEEFDRIIEEALDEARCVIVIWTNKSVDSSWVRAEVGDGLERGILVSVAIERDVRLPLRFRNIHTASLIDWDGKKPSSAFETILSHIEQILGPPKRLEEANRVPNEDLELQDEIAVQPKTKPDENLIIHPEIGAMVEVPAGEFIFQDGKAKIHKPYMIDVYPVTNQQYKKFMEADGYRNDDFWSKEGRQWLKEDDVAEPEYWHDKEWNQPDHPVVGVSYYEAEAFAKWSGKRLPTEKEWERAARGIDGREYPWGDQIDQERFNTAESKLGKTTHVIRYHNGVSPVGCYDMAGNVWEWTASWFEAGKQKRVLRGGSWYGIRNYAQCANRHWNYPNYRYIYIGFRCAKDI